MLEHDQKSAEELNCHRKPVKQRQRKDVFKTIYKWVVEYKEECYKEVAWLQCWDVTEEKCEDVEDRKRDNVKVLVLGFIELLKLNV